MAAFREELEQLVNAVTAEAAAGGASERLHAIAREAIDVIGKVLDLDDDEATRDELVDEIEAAALVAANRVLAGKPLVRRAVKAALPFVLPGLIDSIAAYTGPAYDWLAENVAPELARLEATIHHARLALD